MNRKAPLRRDTVAHVAYDGEALRDGSMDVRDLAPALLAVGDLLQTANRSLNGEAAVATVKVRSHFRRGSFEISFFLDVLPAVAGPLIVFAPEALKTAKQVAEAVGLITGEKASLFGLLKFLRARKPDEVKPNPDGSFTITMSGNNNTLVVIGDAARLAGDQRVVEAARRVIAPLERPGITTFEVRDGKRVLESITKKDLESFEPPNTTAPMEPVLNEGEKLLEIVKPSFDDGLTWTFSDGQSRFNAVVRDEKFLSRVAGGMTFAKGDLVKVRVASKTSVVRDGLRTEHEVTEVIEIRPRHHQGSLFAAPDAPSDTANGDSSEAPPDTPDPRTKRGFRKIRL